MTDINLIAARVLELAITIQQIAAPTFAEKRRAAFIQQQMLDEGLSDVSMDALGNVYGRLPGQGSALPLIVSAHLDTVFPEETPLTCIRSAGQISGPGIGDNSLGVAGLFGLLWMLRSQALGGDVWLVANVGEEGLGDLSGIKAVVERFGHTVQAYLILEGMSLGHVYHRGLGVQRYRITVRTQGGHSWVNYGRPSAINHLAHLITQLEAIELPRHPRTTLNVGVVAGGTSINTIAAEAHLELDLRSEDSLTLQKLAQRVEALVSAAQQAGGRNEQSGVPSVEVCAQIIGQRPTGMLPKKHILVRLAEQCIEAQGIQPVIGIGSTDANIPLSLGIPAVCVGLTYGGGAHTIDEFIQTDPLPLGLAQLQDLVVRTLNLSLA